MPNEQPTKELHYFQQLVCSKYTVQKLNSWIDELTWENEKKDRVIEMKYEEIQKVNQLLEKKKKEINDLGNAYNELLRKHEAVKGHNKKKVIIRNGVFPR